jgi:VWFA-related protein
MSVVKRIPFCGLLALAAFAQLKTPHGDAPAGALPLLQIDAVVTDAQGRPVTNLGPADFEIRDGGAPRRVATFAYVNAHPGGDSLGGVYQAFANFALPPIDLKPDEIRRTLVLVVDDLSFTESAAAQVRAALQHFIGAQMQAGDAAAIVRASGDGPGCLHGIASDAKTLLAAADCVTYDYRRPAAEGAAATGQTVALRTAIDALRETPGRKAVVLLSSHPASAGLQSLRESARAAAAVFYSVQVEGEAREDSESGVGWLASMTGGWAIPGGSGVSDALARVLRDQEGYYLLGYHADEDWMDSFTMPEIAVHLKREGLRLRYRSGPMGKAGEEPETRGEDPSEWAGLAISPALFDSAVGVRMTALFSNSSALGSYADVLLHIDGGDLVFTRDLKGIYHGSLDVAAVALGDSSLMAPRKGGEIAQNLTEEEYRNMRANGLMERVRVGLPLPGGYQVVAVVRDGASGAIGMARQFLEAPNLPSGLALSGIVLKKGDEQTGPDEMIAVESKAPAANPAVRQFQQLDSMIYAYRIFNLAVDAQGKSRIEATMRILRDGNVVYTGQTAAIPFSPQGDPQRRAAGGVIHLGNRPGKYWLEVTVRDLLAQQRSEVKGYMDYEVR